MTYGITGNTQKDKLWEPVAELVAWLTKRDLSFCLHADVAQGLRDRDLINPGSCSAVEVPDLASRADVILSFGGDGTLLRSAHELGESGKPILGVNIGRLGFLATVEVGHVREAIERLEEGDFRIEERMTLSGEIADATGTKSTWALNEFVIERGGPVGLMSIDVIVDGTFLNSYWSDGLIVATPTGSTAYSLAVGGPIVAPGSDVIILSPVAPHSLTVRPIVIPATSVVEVRVVSSRQPYVVAADGMSTPPREDPITLVIRRGRHAVRLVRLPGQHYFRTLRSKLMWGAGNH